MCKKMCSDLRYCYLITEQSTCLASVPEEFGCNVCGVRAVSYTHLDVYKRQMLVTPLRKIFVPKLVEIGPVVQGEVWKTPKDPIEKNTNPMLVLPSRKIFVPSLVEIGPVVQEEMWKTPKAVSYTHLQVQGEKLQINCNKIILNKKDIFTFLTFVGSQGLHVNS